MDAQFDSCESIIPPMPPISDKKVICIKCEHLFPKSQYQHHRQICNGRFQKYFYTSQVTTSEFPIMQQIDLLDFPFSKPSVQVSSVSKGNQHMIELKIKRTTQICQGEICCFCGDLLKNKDECLSLPCAHLLHKKCINKWLIIVDPCKICCKDEEQTQTNHTQPSSSLFNSH